MVYSKMKLRDRYTTIFLTTSIVCVCLLCMTFISSQHSHVRQRSTSRQTSILINDLKLLKETSTHTDGLDLKPHISQEPLTVVINEQQLLLSDAIPLNRNIPDSRHARCIDKLYNTGNKTVSIIFVVQNEIPSVLLRTLYSIIIRTSQHLLEDIIIVDDASTTGFVKYDLGKCIKDLFPGQLIKLIRLEESVGEVAARQIGAANASGDVLVFMRSSMEVNHQWLEPLLHEIHLQGSHTVALSNTDSILQSTYEYSWDKDHVPQLYGFDWSLSIFQTLHRSYQLSVDPATSYRGIVITGSILTIDKMFFQQLGGFDTNMQPNGTMQYLEFSWKIWLCGGQIKHVPCSKLGQLQREQLVSSNLTDYKRSVDMWMEAELKQFVYNFFPKLQVQNTSKISVEPELKYKQRHSCQPFSWYINNVWPELFVYHRDVLAWGSLQNFLTSRCLDNHGYLMSTPGDLFAEVCHYKYLTQGFSLTKKGQLRTTLHCMAVAEYSASSRPVLQPCDNKRSQTWTHALRRQVKHVATNLCLDIDEWGPIMKGCQPEKVTQQWMFTKYVA